MTFQLVNPENPDLCDPSLSQWYLDPALGERIVEWAMRPFDATGRIAALEPSCGRGALLLPLWRHPQVAVAHGVDIGPGNVRGLLREHAGLHVTHADFLKYTPPHGYELAVANPPFENGQTERHILRALEFCTRVVCHCPLTTLAGKDRREGLWSTAYLKRLVIHAARPKYSGSRTGGMTDMCTIDVVRRPEGKSRGRVAASGVSVEWW